MQKEKKNTMKKNKKTTDKATKKKKKNSRKNWKMNETLKIKIYNNISTTFIIIELIPNIIFLSNVKLNSTFCIMLGVFSTS